MVFLVALLIFLIPIRIDTLEPGITQVRLIQRERMLALVVENESRCWITVLGPRARTVLKSIPNCLRRELTLIRGTQETESQSPLQSIAIENPRAKRDHYGFFEAKSGTLILPIVPSIQDRRFSHFWNSHKIRRVFLFAFGKFKSDLKHWERFEKIPWFLPDHKKRENPEWKNFLNRKDWPPEFRWRFEN